MKLLFLGLKNNLGITPKCIETMTLRTEYSLFNRFASLPFLGFTLESSWAACFPIVFAGEAKLGFPHCLHP